VAGRQAGISSTPCWVVVVKQLTCAYFGSMCATWDLLSDDQLSLHASQHLISPACDHTPFLVLAQMVSGVLQ
jgi:hypothetical protein